MPWVVDGDNLLGTWRGRSRSDGERRALVQEIRRLARAERRRIVVVFDGTPPTPQAAGADVLYSGPGRRADDVILDLLRRESDPRGWTVVTLDRALADQSRWLGASHERCETFRARLERPTEDDEKPRLPDDLDEWEKIFGGG